MEQIDPREPFDDFEGQNWCDTCAGTPDSHVCLNCLRAITSALCERLSGFCGVECQKKYQER
jgi:hypothetical protein